MDRKNSFDGEKFQRAFDSSMEGREEGEYGLNNEYFFRLAARNLFPDEDEEYIEDSVEDYMENFDDGGWREDNEDVMRMFYDVQQEDFEEEEEAYWKHLYDTHIRGNRYSNVTGMTDAFETLYVGEDSDSDD